MADNQYIPTYSLDPQAHSLDSLVDFVLSRQLHR